MHPERSSPKNATFKSIAIFAMLTDLHKEASVLQADSGVLFPSQPSVSVTSATMVCFLVSWYFCAEMPMEIGVPVGRRIARGWNQVFGNMIPKLHMFQHLCDWQSLCTGRMVECAQTCHPVAMAVTAQCASGSRSPAMTRSNGPTNHVYGLLFT